MFKVSEVYIRSGVNTLKNQQQNTKYYNTVDKASVQYMSTVYVIWGQNDEHFDKLGVIKVMIRVDENWGKV